MNFLKTYVTTLEIKQVIYSTYKGVRNICFSDNFVYVLNEWFFLQLCIGQNHSISYAHIHLIEKIRNKLSNYKFAWGIDSYAVLEE